MNTENLLEEQKNFLIDFGDILAARCGDSYLDDDQTRFVDEGAQDFARYVRAMRLNAGWLPLELAQKAGVSEAEVIALERGLILSTKIEPKLLYSLAEALGENIEDFALILSLAEIPKPDLTGVPAQLRDAWRVSVAYFGSNRKLLIAVFLTVVAIVSLTIFAYSEPGRHKTQPPLVLPSNNIPSSPQSITPAVIQARDQIRGFNADESFFQYSPNSYRLARYQGQHIETPSTPVLQTFPVRNIQILLITILLLVLIWLAIWNGHLPLKLVKRERRWEQRLIYSTPLTLLCVLVITGIIFTQGLSKRSIGIPSITPTATIASLPTIHIIPAETMGNSKITSAVIPSIKSSTFTWTSQRVASGSLPITVQYETTDADFTPSLISGTIEIKRGDTGSSDSELDGFDVSLTETLTQRWFDSRKIKVKFNAHNDTYTNMPEDNFDTSFFAPKSQLGSTISAHTFTGWGRYAPPDGFYALALQFDTYTFPENTSEQKRSLGHFGRGFHYDQGLTPITWTRVYQQPEVEGPGHYASNLEIIEAFISDRTVLAQVANELELNVMEETFTNEPYGIVVSEDDPKIRDLVNYTLTASVALGDLTGGGDLDAVVGNLNQNNEIWLNDGWGHFAHRATNTPIQIPEHYPPENAIHPRQHAYRNLLALSPTVLALGVFSLITAVVLREGRIKLAFKKVGNPKKKP